MLIILQFLRIMWEGGGGNPRLLIRRVYKKLRHECILYFILYNLSGFKCIYITFSLMRELCGLWVRFPQFFFSYFFCDIQPWIRQCTQSAHRVAIADFWRTTFQHDGKISPGWWGWGWGCTPTPFHSFTITYKVAVYVLAERKIHFPYFISTLYVLCAPFYRYLISSM